MPQRVLEAEARRHWFDVVMVPGPWSLKRGPQGPLDAPAGPGMVDSTSNRPDASWRRSLVAMCGTSRPATGSRLQGPGGALGRSNHACPVSSILYTLSIL